MTKKNIVLLIQGLDYYLCFWIMITNGDACTALHSVNKFFTKIILFNFGYM